MAVKKTQKTPAVAKTAAEAPKAAAGGRAPKAPTSLKQKQAAEAIAEIASAAEAPKAAEEPKVLTPAPPASKPIQANGPKMADLSAPSGIPGPGSAAELAPKESFQASLHEPDNPLAVLEAALFMSGQPIGAADLAKLVGIAALGHVNELLSKLSESYARAGSALEVVQEENGKWVMRVRASYAGSVRNFAGEAEITKHALRTLAYISKNEGIKKRDLFMRLGSTIYEDVAELLEKGFVSATPAGRTVSLKTTAKFRQYFNS